MTLLITVFAALFSTVIWYRSATDSHMMVGVLSLIYWGASIMWFVDAIFEYAELKDKYFTPGPEEMLNDFYLGLSVVALGMIVWIVILLIKDPKGVFKKKLFNKTVN